MRYKHFLLLITLLSIPFFSAMSQGYSLEIYNKDRNKNTNKYDKYDDLLQETDPSYPQDTSSLEGKLMTSPDELRKLGASEAVIERLMQLNNIQDSLENVKFEERLIQTGTDDDTIDSLSIDEIQDLIQQQKEELVRKALSLPEAYVYGHEFFRRNTLKILDPRELDLISTPDHYQLSTNDELTIATWGTMDYNETFKIDAAGTIAPNTIGKIYLRGLSYAAAQSLIKQKFASTFAINEDKIEVRLSFSRVITANFVGEMLNPGSYKFPAATSVYNALVAIDGPNQLGSVRTIYVKRAGKTIQTLDIYKYLSEPDTQQEYFLEDNDYIVVPSMGNVVNISGQVRRPHNYEIKSTENLSDLIGYAGGLKPEAFTKNINIKRYKNNREVLIDVNLDSLRRFKADFPIQNGDSVFVYRVPIGLRNYIEVTGAVRVPGRYEVEKGDKISDVLYKTEGVLEEADLNRAYVIRLKEDMSKRIIPFKLGEVIDNPNSSENVSIENLDTIQVLSRKDYRQNFSVQITGAVRQEGEFEYVDGLTLKDLLYWSGGLNKEAANNRVEISRVVKFSDDNTGENTEDRIVVKRVEVNPDISIDENASDFELRPFDHVFVRVAPDFREPENVHIYGEVVYPGEYPLLSREENITSLIERSGGFTKFAFEKGSKLYRVEDSTFVLLDLEKAFKRDKSKYNCILAEGDSIFIPKMKNIVSLGGAMRHFEVDTIENNISVPYEPRKRRAKYYVNRYGAGFGRDAKRSRTYVTHPNGNVHQTRNLGIVKIYPKVENGSHIFVDVTDRKRREAIREERRKNKNWNDAFDNFTSKVATVLTILVLVRQTTL